MDITCASQGIIDLKYPKQGVSDIASAGFQNILLDLSAACPPWELEQIGKPGWKTTKTGLAQRALACQKELQGNVNAVIEQCNSGGLGIPAVIAPYLNHDTKRDDLKAQLSRLAEESVEVGGRARCRYLIVKPLFAGIPKERLWEENRGFYLGIAEHAKKYDIQILLENQCRSHNGHLVRGLCSDGGQAAEWIDALNEAAGEERFGFCMDVGACNLCGQNMYDVVLSLGSRLKTVILRDCDGNSDSALLPFTSVVHGQSRTDWMNLIRGLREIGFNGELVMDIHDTAAAFSPILRPGLLQMAKPVADYFAWQIGIEKLLKRYPSRVLFGAGNMCRNYMKCYGEKYPPLFTCDNNRNIWETEFCGLTVKPPGALLSLPEDCAVFICNIYYREIKAQLREMGIKNPIEFFNDEYMPSFCFDRLEERG